jgi:hypothetical protein
MQFDNYKTIILDFVSSDSRLSYNVYPDEEDMLLVHINSKKTKDTVIFRLHETAFLHKYVAFFGCGLEVEEKLTDENFYTVFATMKQCLNEGRTLWAYDENKDKITGLLWTDDKHYTPKDVFIFFNEECKESFELHCKQTTRYLSFWDFYGENTAYLKLDGDTFVVDEK